MVVWSSALRSIAQPGLTSILSKPGTVQAIVKNGKYSELMGKVEEEKTAQLFVKSSVQFLVMQSVHLDVIVCFDIAS